MIKPIDKNSQLLQLSWAIYFVLMICVVYLTRKLFKSVFPDETMYIPLLVAIIAIWIVILVGFKYFKSSSNIIGSILLVSTLFLAIYWLFFSAALPAIDLNSSSCVTWDCFLLQELEAGKMLDSWVNSQIGLASMVIIQFSVLPSFLFMLSAQNHLIANSGPNRSETYIDSAQPNIFAGISIWVLFGMALLCILIGVVEVLLPNFAAVVFISLLYFGLSSLIFVISSRSHIPSLQSVKALSDQSERTAQSEKMEQLPEKVKAEVPEKDSENKSQAESLSQKGFRFHIGSALVNLLMLTAFTIFVFTFVDVRDYPLERLWQIGLGIILFLLIYIGLIVKMPRDSNDLIRRINLSFFAVIIIASIQGTHFYFSSSSLVSDTGLSPVLSGVLLACFSIRMMLFSMIGVGSKQQRGIPIKHVDSTLLSLLILNICLFLIFVGSLFEIYPRDRDAFIVFLPAVLLGIIGLLITLLKRK